MKLTHYLPALLLVLVTGCGEEPRNSDLERLVRKEGYERAHVLRSMNFHRVPVIGAWNVGYL